MNTKKTRIMRKLFIISALLLFLGIGESRAQENASTKTQNNKKVLFTKIECINGTKFDGKFYKINDSIITIAKAGENADSIFSFHYCEINSISMNRKGSFLRGFAFGLGATSLGSAAIALAGSENSFLGPVGDFIIIEILLGVPISAGIGLVDAIRGKKIDAEVLGNFNKFQSLNLVLKKEKTFSSTKNAVTIKQFQNLTLSENKTNNVPQEIAPKDTLNHPIDMPVSEDNTRKKLKIFGAPKYLESPLKFHLKFGLGPKLSNNNQEVYNYLNSYGFVDNMWDDAGGTTWNIDFSVPLKKHIFLGFQYQFNHYYTNISRYKTFYSPENVTEINITANSTQFVPYLSVVNKHICTLHPHGLQLAAKTGLIIEKGYLYMATFGTVDGNWYFDEEKSLFKKSSHYNIGLQLQATAEYYFFENFSVLAGVAGELKPSVKFESVTFAPSGYDPIVFDEFKLNLSNLYIFGGIGIHF